MAKSRPRVKVPKKAAKGDIITLKTLISHKMESGQRKDKKGKKIPRQIINKFICEFNGATVFSCDIEPAVSANPYLQFTAKVEESGEFQFTWIADNGDVFKKSQKIAVA